MKTNHECNNTKYKNKTNGSLSFNHDDLTSHLSLQSDVYHVDEFLYLRKQYQGANFTIHQKPELLQHKELLEKIRMTGRTNILALEHEGSDGFVVQISDMCIKFKNEKSEADFEKEIKYYLLIEQLHGEFTQIHNITNFKIPGLQRHLCSKDYITMEYIEGLTLSLQHYLTKYTISLNQIIQFLEQNFSNYEDLRYIYQKGNTYGYKSLKEYDLRTILSYYHPQSIDILEDMMRVDKKTILNSLNENQLYKDYMERKKYLRKNNITFTDDHNDNFKYENGVLYRFDFGNIVVKPQ